MCHGTREVDPGEPAAVEQETTPVRKLESAGFTVDAHDLTAVVDLQGLGCAGAREVDPAEPAVLLPQEAVHAAGIVVVADDLAAIVDADGEGLRSGAGDLERGVAPPIQQKTRELDARRGGGRLSWSRACSAPEMAPQPGSVPKPRPWLATIVETMATTTGRCRR